MTDVMTHTRSARSRRSTAKSRRTKGDDAVVREDALHGRALAGGRTELSDEEARANRAAVREPRVHHDGRDVFAPSALELNRALALPAVVSAATRPMDQIAPRIMQTIESTDHHGAPFTRAAQT